MTTKNEELTRRAHGHLWIVGALGIVIGGGTLLLVPRLEVVGRNVLLFAGVHLLGALVLVASGLYLRSLGRSIDYEALGDRVDYGWGPGWMNGLGVIASTTCALAILVQLLAPGFWPLAFAL